MVGIFTKLLIICKQLLLREFFSCVVHVTHNRNDTVCVGEKVGG